MTDTTLDDLGWSPHFSRQLTDDDIGEPARVSAVHRSIIEAITPRRTLKLSMPESAGNYAVGDWVLADAGTATRRLDRLTELSRRAAGEVAYTQLIAANVDTLGIVTSCNADFNIARLERYLALAETGGCLPLIILTKADQCDDPTSFVRQAERLSPLITAIALNAKDVEDAELLAPWCSNGKTLALVGSSGVGKTTLQNRLTGVVHATADIRQDDAKGRHTTTARFLRKTQTGGWLIDTPGMRELRLTDASEGIDQVFSDLAELATECKFNDCAHESEPGCAIRAAIASGDLDPDRLERWQKLEAEDRHNSATIAQKHARARQTEKKYDQGRAKGRQKRGN